MDFNSLVDTYPIDKPPERLPLWPDPVATWNLGGDHWQAIRGFHTEATLNGRNFVFNIPPGFLVDLKTLPATLRWFVKPHSQGGLALILWQYLIDREIVYDTEGKPHRLLRHQINMMVLAGLSTTDAISGWRLWLAIAQMTAKSFKRYYTPNVNPRKVFMETHYEVLDAKKKSKADDRAQRHT